jgi:ornithine cyclodeaminase/alanine dehydrogenase-like protein (mu-crystallin family)
MPTAVPYLSEAQVNECLDPAALIEAMRQVLIDLSAGKANQPLRMVMQFDAPPEQSAGGVVFSF